MASISAEKVFLQGGGMMVSVSDDASLHGHANTNAHIAVASSNVSSNTILVSGKYNRHSVR